MNGFDPMNSNGFNYGNQGQNPSWGQPRSYGGYMPQQPMQPRFYSNVITVTSLEEALIKTTERNSDMIYFHQDKNEFYRVKVDPEGRKTWAVFLYNVPNQEASTPATKADIATLLQRIEALEQAKKAETAQINNGEVTTNAEPNG